MNPFDVKETESNIQEKAILVGVLRSGAQSSYSDPLSELVNLAHTVDVEVLATVTQRRNRFHPSTYVGHGKVQEIKELAEELNATLIICDDDLSPGQAKKLEQATGVRVVDRTELILDIFAMHARTKEGKLQVGLAQMEYVLPRLRRMWTHLQGSQGGVGFRGPGEKQLEKDRQLVKKRIADSTRALEKIQKRKNREVSSRKQRFFTISLVGYTNAGKSSLMNALTNAEVLVEDKLFATLDTKTSLWEIAQGRKALLSDTVGFINKLPHHLVASFRATLEEASQADILLHVVDISHPDAEQHIDVVNRVLKKVGIGDCPTLLVFNKIDLLHDEVDLEHLKRKFPQHVCLSAKTGENLDSFRKEVISLMEETMVEIDASLPATNGKLQAWISEYARVVKKQFNGQTVHFRAYLSQQNAQWLKQQPGVKIR